MNRTPLPRLRPRGWEPAPRRSPLSRRRLPGGGGSGQGNGLGAGWTGAAARPGWSWSIPPTWPWLTWTGSRTLLRCRIRWRPPAAAAARACLPDGRGQRRGPCAQAAAEHHWVMPGVTQRSCESRQVASPLREDGAAASPGQSLAGTAQPSRQATRRRTGRARSRSCQADPRPPTDRVGLLASQWRCRCPADPLSIWSRTVILIA